MLQSEMEILILTTDQVHAFSSIDREQKFDYILL